MASPLRWIFLSVAVSLVVPRVAAGQVEAAALARIKLLNKRAMDEYDGLEFEAAKTLLLEALTVAEKASITRGRTLTATLLNLGVVVGAGLNDRISAVKYFSAALRVDASASLNPARATPSLEEMFNAARENLRKEPVPARSAFVHTPVDETVEGRRVRLYARVQSTLSPSRVVLFFRGSGTSEYSETPMREVRPGVYLGVIPPDAVSGRSLNYYLEAQDGAGQRVAGHGSAVSPNIISVNERRAKPRGRGGDRSTGPSAKVFSVAVMIGSGIGVVNGGQSEHEHPQSGGANPVDINPGGALTPFHVAPELIYHLSKDWHLSLLARIQLVNAINVPDGAVSVLGEARTKRFFGAGPARFYLAFGAGAGQMRHRIALGDYDEDANNPNVPLEQKTPDDRVDTRLASIVAFGLGGGLVYMFSDYVGFVAELNGLIVVPAFAAQLDLNTGLILSF